MWRVSTAVTPIPRVAPAPGTFWRASENRSEVEREQDLGWSLVGNGELKVEVHAIAGV